MEQLTIEAQEAKAALALQKQLEGIRVSFFRAMVGRAGNTAEEFRRTVNGIELYRAAGGVVTGDTLWGPKDWGRCDPVQLSVWKSVAGAIANVDLV